MCGIGQCCCEQPRVRKPDPKGCTPEQVHERHDDTAEQACCGATHSCRCSESADAVGEPGAPEF